MFNCASHFPAPLYFQRLCIFGLYGAIRMLLLLLFQIFELFIFRGQGEDRNQVDSTLKSSKIEFSNSNSTDIVTVSVVC